MGKEATSHHALNHSLHGAFALAKTWAHHLFIWISFPIFHGPMHPLCTKIPIPQHLLPPPLLRCIHNIGLPGTLAWPGKWGGQWAYFPSCLASNEIVLEVQVAEDPGSLLFTGVCWLPDPGLSQMLPAHPQGSRRAWIYLKINN